MKSQGLVSLLWLIWATTWAVAQEPVVKIIPPEGDVVLGQSATLRITLLVSTHMPQPPVFPSFEAHDILIRNPSRNSSPTSERIDGDTWSGVTRTMRFFPMKSGSLEIPGGDLIVTYANPSGGEPLRVTLPVPAVPLNVVVPKGAEGLDPVIVANGLSGEQSWAGPKGDLAVGDIVTREVTISIEGAPPLLIPEILAGAAPINSDANTEGNRAFSTYPDDAYVEETEDRGVLEGTRTEKVSYVAQTGGKASFPAIRLEWYNLSKNIVEIFELDGREYQIIAPPPTAELNMRSLAIWATASTLLLLTVYLRRRPILFRLASLQAALVARQRRRPRYLLRQVRKAARRRNFSEVTKGLEHLNIRYAIDPKVAQAMSYLGQELYGPSADARSQQVAWVNLDATLKSWRLRSNKSHERSNGEMALNP